MLALLLALQLPSPVEPWSVAQAVSPEGKSIALGVDDGSLRCIDLDSGKERFRGLDLSRALEGLSWSPDGKQVATIGRDGEIVVLRAEGGARTSEFSSYGGPSEDDWCIHTIDFVDAGRKLLSRGGGSRARLLDGSSGTVLESFEFHPNSPMMASAVSADELHFALGDAQGECAVYCSTTGKREAGPFHLPKEVRCLAFDSHAARIAVGAGDAKVRVFPLAGGATPLELVHDGRLELPSVPSIGSVCFSPDGKMLLSSTCDDFYEVRCWDLEHSSVLWKYEYEWGTEFPAPATFSKAGDLAVLWVDGIVSNSKTGKTVRTIGVQPVGWHLYSTGDKAWVCSKGEVRVYDVRDGKLIRSISLSATAPGTAR